MLIALSVLNLVMKADVIGAFSGTTQASVPGFGKVPVLAGQGYIQGYVLSALAARAVSPTEPLPPSARGWLPAYARIVQGIPPRPGGAAPVVDLATDEPLLNSGDLILAARLHEHRDLTVNLVPGGATLGGPPDAVVTVSYVGFSYFALSGQRDADQGLLERASNALGLRCSETVGLPDDRLAVLSTRALTASPASCSPRVTHVNLIGASVIAVFNLPMDWGLAVACVRAHERHHGAAGAGNAHPVRRDCPRVQARPAAEPAHEISRDRRGVGHRQHRRPAAPMPSAGRSAPDNLARRDRHGSRRHVRGLGGGPGRASDRGDARAQRGQDARADGLGHPHRRRGRDHPGRRRSTDETLEVARRLPLHLIWHPHNVGYGGNQKTCYLEALQRGADVVVMLHPDGQYEPSLIPRMVEPILRGEADMVLGSRLAEPGAWRPAGCPATSTWPTAA